MCFLIASCSKGRRGADLATTSVMFKLAGKHPHCAVSLIPQCIPGTYSYHKGLRPKMAGPSYGVGFVQNT